MCGTPVPPGPGWVLVRPALAGICGTDLALVHRDPVPNVLTAYSAAGTFIPGHEVVGVIERAATTRWAHEGDRVLVEPNSPLRSQRPGRVPPLPRRGDPPLRERGPGRRAVLRPVGRLE